MTGARQRVTFNEVLRRSRRALTALGAGPGCEREPGDGVAWLESHGLDGVACLCADLGALRAAHAMAARDPRESDGALVLDARGGSGLFVVLQALDLALATDRPVRVVNVRWSPWLLPYLAVADGTAGMRGLLLDGRGSPLLQARVDAQGGVNLHGVAPLPILAGRARTVRLERAPPAALPGDGWELDRHALQARHRDALERGMQVDACAWRGLGAVAAEALVPASESSRARGAGGGDDNA